MEISQFFSENGYYFVVLVMVMLLFKNRILSRVYKLQSISIEDAFQNFKSKSIKALFLDVRTPWELENDPRIKNSKSIPLSQLSNRLGEIKSEADANKKIIVVCRSGNRAVAAGINLKKAGLEDVYVMQGGISRWQRADYPVSIPKPKKGFG